jgi:hypothetical protein
MYAEKSAGVRDGMEGFALTTIKMRPDSSFTPVQAARGGSGSLWMRARAISGASLLPPRRRMRLCPPRKNGMCRLLYFYGLFSSEAPNRTIKTHRLSAFDPKRTFRQHFLGLSQSQARALHRDVA